MTKAISVGSSVALTEEYVSLFESFAARNVVHEVVDCRHLGAGEYALTIAVRLTSGMLDVSTAREVYADDVRAIL